MRHSSWTLFLVPLALPLVLLLPGVVRTNRAADPVVRAQYEFSQDQGVPTSESLPNTTTSPKKPHPDVSEAFYKD